MMACYLDTSALIKRYIDEVGSDWLRTMLNAQQPSILVVHLVIVEVTSALTRRLREGVLTQAEYALIQNAFRADCLNDYEMITAAGDVLDQASRLLETHPLRAYDAVHLAAALVANRQLLANGLPALTFLSADDHLLNAAAAEGLPMDNPNHHP